MNSSVDNIEKSVDTTAGIVAAARAKAQKVVAGTSFLCTLQLALPLIIFNIFTLTR